jgi:hypothetical protein
MANTNDKYGLKIVNTLPSSRFELKTIKCITVTTDATALFIQDPVKLTSAMDTDEFGNYYPVVTQASASDAIFGVVAGFAIDKFFNQYRKESTKRVVDVVIDPMALISIQCRGVFATTDIGKLANIYVGSGNVYTGISGVELDAATIGSGTQLKIIAIEQDNKNAIGQYTKLLCAIVRSEMTDSEDFWDRVGTTLKTHFANDDVELDNNLTVHGKLTVDGLIDPTALVLTPQATAPATTDGTFYYDGALNSFRFRENGVWINLADEVLWDDDGTDLYSITGRNINLKGAGLKDTNVTTAIKLGDALNTSFATTNKTIVGALNEAYQWNRVDLGAGDYVLTPTTATDEIQVPTSGAAGQILYTDLSGNKKITGSDTLKWDGSGITNTAASPYFRAASNLSTSPLSGLKLYNTNDGSSSLYHNNEVGDSILDIDALTGTNGISTIRFGYNTTAATYRYLFYSGPASYSAHPTFSSDTQIVDKKYVDDAINVENLWNRVDLGGGDFVLTPTTATDEVQVPTTGSAGQILYTDLSATKKITGSDALKWDGSGITLNSAAPYFRAISNLATSQLSGLKMYNTNDGSSSIYHNNQLGDSILDIDALTATGGISTIRFGYNTTGSSLLYLFYVGMASYSSHPTFTNDNQIVDKKYVDDAVVWSRALISGSDYRLIPENTADVVNLPTTTASSLIGVNASKDIVTITALPNGTTATTQAASDNSTKVATTAYVDAAVLVENLWNRVDLGAGDYVLTPTTATDEIQVPTSGNAGQILYTDLSGNKKITGDNNFTRTAIQYTLGATGAADSINDVFILKNNQIGTINTGQSIEFYQFPQAGAAGVLFSAGITARNTDTWDQGTPTSIDSQLEFYTVTNGIRSLIFYGDTTGLRVHNAANLDKWVQLSNSGQIQIANKPASKTSTDLILLENKYTAADNDGMATAIKVQHAASDGTLYDCGKMYWKNEIDWTSTASTRDSSLVFQVAVDGTLTDRLIVGSSEIDIISKLGSAVYIGSAGSPSNREFVFWNDFGTGSVIMEIDSKDIGFQSMVRFKKNGSLSWDITSRHELDAPNNRLSFYYGGSTQLFYMETSGKATFASGGITMTSGNLLLSSGGITLTSGSIDVTGSVYVDSGSAYYWGAFATDGTWRAVRSGNNLIFARREAGSYVTKSTISA